MRIPLFRWARCYPGAGGGDDGGGYELAGEGGCLEGVALLLLGEDLSQEQGSAGLDGGETVLPAEAVNGPA